MQVLAAALRARNARERFAFEGLVSENRSLSCENAAHVARAREMERELIQMRHEAADVFGRRDAFEAAARLEVRVLELQEESRDAVASSRSARAAAASAEARAAALAREAKTATSVAETLRAEVAARTAQKDAAEQEIAMLRGELERARRSLSARDEEARELKKENEDLVLRLVGDKERLVTEMNSMNEIIKRLRAELVPVEARWAVVPPPATELTLRRASRDGNVVDVCFSRAGDVVATGGSDVKLYHKADDFQGPVLKATLATPASVLRVALSFDLVAASCVDETVRVFDSRSARPRLDVSPGSHGCEFLGKAALATAADRLIKVWDLKRTRAAAWQRRSPAACRGLAASAENVFSSAHADGVVRTWDTRTDAVVAETKAHDAPISALAASGTTLATLGVDATLKLVDGRTMGTLAALSHDRLEGVPDITRIALSMDGRHLATPSTAAGVLLFDTQTGHCATNLRTSAASETPLAAVDCAPKHTSSTTRLIIASLDTKGHLRLWD